MTNTVPASSESWIVEAWSSGLGSSRTQPASRELADDGALLQAEFILCTITQLLQCADSEEGSRLLANRLQQFFGCRQVAIGLCGGRRGRCRIRGLSGVVRLDSHSGFINSLQDALEETLVRDKETAWPPRQESGDHATRAHEKLVSLLGADCVASIPLRDGQDRTAAVLLLIDERAEGAFTLIRRHGTALASCLRALEREQRNFVSRRIRKLMEMCYTWRGRAICVAVATAALLLAVPWPYHIECHSQVQPVIRRFVAAPYDGTLEKSFVSPGDMVRAGDLLARMDEREIRWELAGLQAEYTRAEKERDAAMASHKTSGAQLAELEMDRLELQVRLLEHRIENLAIRSPIDGIVVAGDLEKAEGAPLTVGQTLFEVAPLEKMTVEVDIPEDEISHVERGLQVNVNLNAFPDELIAGIVDRIHPHAELRDRKSVFVAELELDNREGRLRPGMSGWATITSDRRSLGWILFHKPWSSIRRALAW